MEYNIDNLSSISKIIEKHKKYKTKLSKLLSGYISPLQSRHAIEPYNYINKDGMTADDCFKRKREDLLLNDFINNLSKSDKQIKEERKEYLNKLKYFNYESEEAIKLKKLKRQENVLLYRKLNFLLDLRKFKVKYDLIKRKISKNLSNNSINIRNDSHKKNNEKDLLKHKIKKNIFNKIKMPNKNIKDTMNKTRNEKEKVHQSMKTPLNTIQMNSLSINSCSSNYTLSNRINRILSTIAIKEKSQIENASLMKEKLENLKSKSKIIKKIDLYKKKWNLPKCINFGKSVGRIHLNKSCKEYERIKDTITPKYSYIFPNTNGKIVFYGNNNDLNKYKKISTKKALFNYINNNQFFDENYNIMNIVNSESQKSSDKNVKLKSISNLISEYLKEKKKVIMK